jgi:hypothetical protein
MVRRAAAEPGRFLSKEKNWRYAKRYSGAPVLQSDPAYDEDCRKGAEFAPIPRPNR